MNNEANVAPAETLNTLSRRRARYIFVLISFVACCILFLMLNIALGSVQIPFIDAAHIVSGVSTENDTYRSIILDIRLPRALAAQICGSALAVSGLLLQIFFRNPVVGPDILGVSSGARLVVAAVVLGGMTLGLNTPAPLLVTLAALAGGIVVMIAVVAVASKVKDIITLLVIGMMVGYIASAFTSFLVAFAESERLSQFTIWTLGSFTGFRWDQLRIAVLFILVLLFFSFLFAKPLNAFLLGESYAQSMGVNIKTFRYFIIIVASSLAAVVTAFAGPVSFIGIAVPHLARISLGTSDNRALIPGTILLGAVLTSFCDLIAKTSFAPIELPISAVTSLFGAPIVIAMLLRRRTSV